MIFNYFEETKEIETVSRYNGGWLKHVTGLDKSVNNGFSLLGEFVEAGDFLEDYKPGVYLDCSKDGSRKNQEWSYHLFRVDEQGFTLLKTLENVGRHFAVEMWEPIEQELSITKQINELTNTQIKYTIIAQDDDEGEECELSFMYIIEKKPEDKEVITHYSPNNALREQIDEANNGFVESEYNDYLREIFTYSSEVEEYILGEEYKEFSKKEYISDVISQEGRTLHMYLKIDSVKEFEYTKVIV